MPIERDSIYELLKNRLATISDLHSAKSLLFWDQQTKMPTAAAPARAEQLATVGRLSHEMFVTDEIGRLLDELRGYEDRLLRRITAAGGVDLRLSRGRACRRGAGAP